MRCFVAVTSLGCPDAPTADGVVITAFGPFPWVGDPIGSGVLGLTWEAAHPALLSRRCSCVFGNGFREALRG